MTPDPEDALSGMLANPSDLNERVEQVTGGAVPGRSLRRGGLRFLRTAALPVGVQGPTAGVIVGPAIIAGIVGEPGVLAQILALVAMGFVAFAFVVFTRSFNTAGSVYAFNGAALGPGYGFVSAWLLLLVYTSFAAGVYASTADIGQALLASLGLHIGWIWLALAGAALALALACASIGFSSLVILVCEGASIALIAAVAVAVLAAGGYRHHGISTAPLTPHGVPLAVLALGVTAAFGQFSGFESAATLGEEARHSTRTIPAAIGWSLAGAAAVYIFFTWIVYTAFPGPAAVAADPAPLVHVARAYLGSGVGVAVNAAGLVSAFGAQLACLNAAARLLYALGRETRGPGSFLTRIWRRHGSPVAALALTGAVSGLAVTAFGFEPAATRAATFIIQYGAYLILAAYLLTIVGALAWTWRTRRRPLPLAVLAAGAVILGYVLYRTFAPFPVAPFGWVVLAAAVSVAAGAAFLAIPGLLAQLRRSPMLAVTAAVRARPGPGRDGR
ncbi:MAG TPA: APC family permease [Streptosporangiaceae bacterium]|jgi:amino acid transporter